MLVHIEGNCANPSVAASTVALAYFRQVDHRLLRRPGIRSDGNLHAEAALAQSHAVNGLGVQIIRNEFVIALKVLVGDVEKDGAVNAFGSLLHNLDRELVAAKQRGQKRSYERLFEDRIQRLGCEQWNKVGDETLVWRGFDDHGQLHSGGFHFYRGLRVGIKGAVNDIGPADQIGYRGGIKPEALLRDHGDEAGAGFEGGIVKLAIAFIVLEVSGIGGREKCALVVIEPPRNLRRTRVFEVDDGVFVAVKMRFVEKRPGAVQQPGINELHIFTDALPIETRKQSRRGSSVETLVMIEDSNFQGSPQFDQSSYHLVRLSAFRRARISVSQEKS